MNFYPSFNDSDFINFDLIEYYSDLTSEIIEDNLFSYKNKDYYETLRLIDKAFETNPNNSILYSIKAFVLYRLDYIGDALICCDVSLNMDDMIDFNWLAKSIILKKLNRKNDALICYKEYVFLKYNKDLDISDINFYKKPIDFEIELDYSFKDYYPNNFQKFEELFNENNLKFIEYNGLTLSQYNDVINKIKERSDEIFRNMVNKYFVDVKSLDLLDKIMLYVKAFSDVEYKSEGSQLGDYVFNKIVLDDRLYTSEQILTLIHELTHHLIREIFEHALMRMLNSSKSQLIEYFIAWGFNKRQFMLMDEYCANKVQSRFMPYGFQEFYSFNEILDNKFEFNSEINLIYSTMKIGKTFSRDILSIIEDYIDINMREEIKNQFNRDSNSNPDYSQLKIEDVDEFSNEEKIKALNSFIYKTFREVINYPDEFKKICEGV